MCLRAFPEYPLAPSDRACGNIGKYPNHQRNECLDLHHKALVTEMEGIATSPDETMDMDAWVEYIQHTLLRILEVHVPSRLILQVVAPIAPFEFAAHSSICFAPVEIFLVFQAGGPCNGYPSKQEDPC